jgi:hypothetical protein
MGRMQREITKRLVGHDSESRHVFAVACDRQYCCFRILFANLISLTNVADGQPYLDCWAYAYAYPCLHILHVAVNSSAWKTGADAIHLQAAVLADRCTMHHVSVTHTNVSRQTAVKLPSH